MKADPVRQQIGIAARACEEKHAEDLIIIQMDKSSSAFTDYFLICSGANTRQVQAIAESVQMQLKQQGTMPNNMEGYKQAEWVLLDYVDFVVHVFVDSARKFYDLERLWKSATRLTLADLEKSGPTRKDQPKRDLEKRDAETPALAATRLDAAAPEQPQAARTPSTPAGTLVKRLGAVSRKKNPVAAALARGPARTGGKSRKSGDGARGAKNSGAKTRPGRSRSSDDTRDSGDGKNAKAGKTRNPSKRGGSLSKMSVAAKNAKKAR